MSSIDHPLHYNTHPSGVECITVVEHMSFNTGNAMKYLWRAGNKTSDPTEDLQKALWYVERELLRTKGKTQGSAEVLPELRVLHDTVPHNPEASGAPDLLFQLRSEIEKAKHALTTAGKIQDRSGQLTDPTESRREDPRDGSLTAPV